MYTAAGFTLGQPGDLRKTFDDGHFDLVGGVYNKMPCKLAPGVVVATAVVDGLFLSPNGLGQFVPSPDANRSCYLVFTANTQAIISIVTAASVFPGEDRTDTPTGLVGTIEGIWPDTALDLSNGPTTSLADFTANLPLTVKAGKLALAGVADKVVGYVEAGAAVLGVAAIAARVTI